MNREVEIVEGDLLEQNVEIVVNPWNRNVIPWWLLLPQGVSGAIKRKAGLQPFREVARHGAIPLGHAVLTSAGRLPYRGIIHVAGINMFWRASERSIRESVRSVFALIREHGFSSVTFPVIGAGSGGFSAEEALQFICEEVALEAGEVRTVIVRYRARGKKLERPISRWSASC